MKLIDCIALLKQNDLINVFLEKQNFHTGFIHSDYLLIKSKYLHGTESENV